MDFPFYVKTILLEKIKNYGFSVHEESKGLVILSSPKVKIVLSCDYQRSYDLECMISLISEDYFREIRIYEVIRFFHQEKKDILNYSINCYSVENWLLYIGNILMLENAAILQGDKILIKSIEDYCKKQDQIYTENLLLRQICNNADFQFYNKNYEMVVHILAPYYNSLSDSYKMKHDIAKRKLEKS